MHNRPRPTYAHGRRAWVVHLELGRPGSETEAAEMLSAQLGSLDAVVLCTGYNVLTPFDRINVEETNAVLELNLSGAFFALQALAPLVRPRRCHRHRCRRRRPTPGQHTICTTRPPRQDS